MCLAEISIISRTQLYDTKTSIRLLDGHVRLTDVLVDNASNSCIEIAGSSTSTFDLDGSHLSNCAQAGILITTDGLVDINNVTVISGSIGVKVVASEGHFKLRNSSIFDMKSSAVDVTYTDHPSAGTFTLENSVVHN